MILNYDKLCKFQIGGSLILGPKKGAPASQAASSEWPACAHDPLPRVGRRLAALGVIAQLGCSTVVPCKNHHFSWENPLFQWPFSIAMLNYQRVHLGVSINGRTPKWMVYKWNILSKYGL